MERKTKPDWLRAKLPGGSGYTALRTKVRAYGLHTVCEEAKCPNLGDCWERGVATVMILGDTCTRACGFCNVKTGRPGNFDADESLRVAEALAGTKLQHVTLTSVDRDDLDDLGAKVWAETIRQVKKKNLGLCIETLVPDFQGRTELLDLLLDAAPDILVHNMETVRRLQKPVRKFANWKNSLAMLIHAKSRDFITKTGLMVGLGETDAEVLEWIDEMANLKVDILSIGQYLQPTRKHLAVDRYVHPRDFKTYGEYALSRGVSHCESGPLVRSSYHAENIFPIHI